MTDNTARAADSVGPFVPRALVPVTVGRSTINLYPIIDGNMATHERAHAFHINKTALLSQYINLRVQLDALGHQLNLSAPLSQQLLLVFMHPLRKITHTVRGYMF